MFDIEKINEKSEMNKVETNGLFGINELIGEYVSAETAQAKENLNKFFDLIKLCYTDNSYKNRPNVATDGKSTKPCCYIWIDMSDKSFEVLDRQAKKITLSENSAMADKKIAFTVIETENFSSLQEKFIAAAMNIEDIQRGNGKVEYLIYPDQLFEEIDDVKAKITAAYDLKVAEKQRAIEARMQRTNMIKQEQEETSEE